MRNKLWLILTLLIILLLALSLPSVGIADAGSFSGDSDFGGSDWGSSDWGSSDWGSSDWGSSSGSTYYYSDGSSSDDGDGGGLLFPVLLIIVIVIIGISVMSKKRKNGGKSVAPGAVATSQASLKPISELLEYDPLFSEKAFCEKASNLYVQLQNAWQDKKFEPMRAHMTSALYNQFDRQLIQLVRANRTNYVERISVLGVRIMGFMQDDVNDSIVVRLQTRIVDYTLDDNTGKLISGSQTAEKFMDYEYTFIRKKGVLTPEDGEVASAMHCSSCGAPIDVTHSARCEYCGTVMMNSDYDWVISAIKGISQRTAN